MKTSILITYSSLSTLSLAIVKNVPINSRGQRMETSQFLVQQKSNQITRHRISCGVTSHGPLRWQRISGKVTSQGWCRQKRISIRVTRLKDMNLARNINFPKYSVFKIFRWTCKLTQHLIYFTISTSCSC